MRSWVPLFLLATGCLLAQRPDPNWSTSVKLVLSCCSQEAQDSLLSYIGRELRSLGDVTIKDKNAEYTLHIIVLPIISNAGDQTGFAVSTVLTQALDIDYLIDKAYADPVQRRGSKWLYEYKETYLDSNLLTGGPRGLPDLSRDIVVSIDKEFQERRKIWQQQWEQSVDAARKAHATQK